MCFLLKPRLNAVAATWQRMFTAIEHRYHLWRHLHTIKPTHQIKLPFTLQHEWEKILYNIQGSYALRQALCKNLLWQQNRVRP